MPRFARPNVPAVESTATPSPAWLFVVGLLLAARYLQPTEGAVFGDTLWQAQLWLVLALVWCWQTVRDGRRRLRGSLLDVAVWGLVLGHAISTIPVFLEGGDRRAAVNLVWEWAGLAATWFLVRQVFRYDALGRPVAVFAAVLTSLAVLGVWQYHVSTPALAARYASLRQEESTLAGRVGNGDASSEDRKRLGVVQNALSDFSVPDDPGARQRWEDRIQHSTEPLGTFALANTFGGLLAAALPWLVLAVRECWSDRTRGKLPVQIGTVVAACLVLYCLVLTKSRTAWVGLAVGIAFAACLHFVRGRPGVRGRLGRSLLIGGIGVTAVGMLMTAAVLVAGGLDRQVLTEAPKSLQYRLDYWDATWQVLVERPVFGTGPGNFRTHYLEHRLPGASEEIAAPHNLLFDAWTAGGLMSLVLLLILLGRMVWLLWRPSSSERTGDDEPGPAMPNAGWSSLETGAVVAFPLVTAVGWLAGNGIDTRLLAIVPVVAAAQACLAHGSCRSRRHIAAGAGFVALVVHLLGADGLEFPAVSQSLLLLVAVVDPVRTWSLSERYRLLPAIGLGGLAIGCLLTGTVPVLNSRSLKDAGVSAARDGNPAAERVLTEAAEADPWSLEPKVLLAELTTARALGGGSNSDRTGAVRRWEAVLDADPRHLHAREQIASLMTSSAGKDDQATAAGWLEQAVRLSPTDAKLRARLAALLADLGEASAGAEQAIAALELDDRNRAAGHVDQILDEATRTSLERLRNADRSD